MAGNRRVSGGRSSFSPPPSPTAAPWWFKFPFTFLDFQDAGTSKDIKLYDLPAGGFVHAIKAKCSTAFVFAPGPLLMYAYDFVGGQKFLFNFDPTAPVSGTAYYKAGFDPPFSGSHLVVNEIEIHIENNIEAVSPLSMLSAGAIDFWLLMSKAI